MNASFTRSQYSVSCAVCLCALFAVHASGQEGNDGSAPPAKPRLSPDERFKLKQEREKQEMAAEQNRLNNFGAIPESDRSPLAVAYRKASDEFREATAEFSDIQSRLQYRSNKNLDDVVRYRWLDRLQNNYDKLFTFRDAAADLVESDPVAYENVALMLREMLITEVAADRSDRWARAARILLRCNALVNDDMLLNAGYAGFSDSDWDLVVEAWTPLLEKGKLPEVEQMMLRQIPQVRASWEVELERRQADRQRNNPRVEFLTSKGRIEIELFEDEAPETVASFIFLVEKGYYNRKPFFLVRRHFLAQTGCEKGDGKGTAGYTIPFEGNMPNHRNHFRGSLAVPLGINTETQTISPESGGAQFYFSFLPLPIFDGKHTVFGRVVKGIEVLGLLKEVNLTEEEQRKDQSLRPDRVIVARVLNKRDHEYRPNPALGQLPR